MGENHPKFLKMFQSHSTQLKMEKIVANDSKVFKALKNLSNFIKINQNYLWQVLVLPSLNWEGVPSLTRKCYGVQL